jgi:hypothetical protein
MNYQDKLRAFARYLDNHPVLAEKLSVYEYPSIYVYAADWADFQSVIGDLDGYEKDGHGGSLTARHIDKDDEGNLFRVSVVVSGVCEVKPKVDEGGQPVMRRKLKTIELDEFEQENEYVCPEVWSDRS